MTIYTVVWVDGSIGGARVLLDMTLAQVNLFFGSFGSERGAQDAFQALGTQQQVGLKSCHDSS